MRATEHKR